MTKTYFNPGCALSIYKPDMETRILKLLNEYYRETHLHKICCHYEPKVEPGSLIINVCPGCDRRFRSLYEGVSTLSLWELFDGLEEFPFPDYHGMRLSVHDACPVREKPEVHRAIRNLLGKMNIVIEETKFHGTQSRCCGDDFYGKLPIDQIHLQMQKRAVSMPCEEVCVYCISCIKSMYIGGKTPRYMIDLLMGEGTEPQVYDTERWHRQLQKYINSHQN